MIVYLYGPRASLDHRAGPCLAALECPEGTLVDPERTRARIPGDPADWQSGGGLLLHARTGLMGVVALRDDYAGRGCTSLHGPARATPRAKLRHCLPRDLVSCVRCRRIVLVARPADGVGETWLVEPSRWILASIDSALTFPGASGPRLAQSFRHQPARAGVPHHCAPKLFEG